MDQQAELEQIEFENQQLRILKDNLNNLRMRFTQNYYLLMNKEEELNDLQFTNDTLLHKEHVINETINDRNKEIILAVRTEQELDIKIERYQQAGAVYVTKEQLQEQKTEYIKANTNLMTYPIFKNEHNMPQRKKEALRGLAGQILIEMALFQQQIYDVNQALGENNEEEEDDNSEEGQVDIEQNPRWQERQQIKVYYGSNQSSLFATIRVQSVPGQNNKFVIHKITFNELLLTCSRYWQVDPSKQVFIDMNNNMWSFKVNVWEEQKAFLNDIRNIQRRDIYIKMISLTDLRILQRTGAMKNNRDEDEDEHRSKKYKVNVKQQASSESEQEDKAEQKKKVAKKLPFWRRVRNRVRIIKYNISLFFKYVYSVVAARFSRFNNHKSTLSKQITYFIFIIFHLQVIYSRRNIKRNNNCIQFLEKTLFSTRTSELEDTKYSIQDITVVDRVFHFTINHWLNSLYSDRNFQSHTVLDPNHQTIFASRYLILDNPTIQFNNVKPQVCNQQTYYEVGFPQDQLSYYPCYPEYSFTMADTNGRTVDKWTQSMCDIESTTCTSSLKDLYRYRTHQQMNRFPIIYYGLKQDFPNDGIINNDLFSISAARSYEGDNVSTFKTQYILQKWLQFFPKNAYDPSTRGLILSVNLLHLGYNLIFVTVATIEQDPSGEIKVRTRIRPIDLNHNIGLNKILEIIEIVMLGWFTLQIINDIITAEMAFRKEKRRLVFIHKKDKDYKVVRDNEPTLKRMQNGTEVALVGWNILYYIFFLTFVGFKFILHNNENTYAIYQNNYVIKEGNDLSEVERIVQIEEYLESINISLMFLSAFKVFQGSKLLRLYLQTIKHSIKKLVGYFMFCSIFISIFAMVARMLMGSNNHFYRNYLNSVSRLMTIFISRFEAVDLKSNHYTQNDIIMIYFYNVVYIVIGFMILQKYLIVVFSNEYIAQLQHYEEKEGEVDELFLPFSLVYEIISFFVITPIGTILTLIRMPIDKAIVNYKDKQLIKQRIRLKQLSEKENLERDKMRVLLEHGEEAMQLQFNVRIPTEELEGQDKKKDKKEDKKDKKENENENEKEQKEPAKDKK